MVNFEEEKAITIDLQNEEPIQTEVYDINHLPSYKIAEEERRANEKERIANENERKDYYNDFTSKVDSGYFDGDNGVYVGSEPPTDEEVTVWIDPNGTPEVEASNIVFSDNESLQTKYENGDLKGEKGDKGEDGTMSFSDLTEEQKASLKGDKGDKGDVGEKGYTPVKGVDYFTEDDIASLNIPTKTSDLTNDSGYITTIPSEYVTETELEDKGYLTGKDISNTNFLLAKVGVSGNQTVPANTYTKVKFDKVMTIEEGLELTSDGGIKINNNNISKCIVSGQIRYESAGNLYIAIRKNDSADNESVYVLDNAQAFTIMKDFCFLAVNPGDTIYIYAYSTTENTVKGGGNPPIWTRIEILGL